MRTTEELLDSLLQHKVEINLASTEVKNKALSEMAKALEEDQEAILAANQEDMAAAETHGISSVMQDRLLLSKERIADMADGVRSLIDLEDPVGRVLEEKEADNGMKIQKVSTAFGLIGMIYESRPNVTSDAAALAIKSGNAVLLRSGKEAIHSSRAIVAALKKGVERSGISPAVLELVEDTSRSSAMAMMTAKGKIDLLVPRGGAGLIQAVVEQATVPVIETGTGICHVYVDQDADIEKALAIVENAKTSRPSVCNSAEVLLVHESLAERFLSALENQLDGRVEFRASLKAQPYLHSAVPAQEEDFDTEFLDYILAVDVVKDVQEAVEHIARHSTGHSEAIVTENPETASYFTSYVDAAAVYVNVSTRFTDGGQFGLGCELGISTQKMHARGPMALAEMTTYKYIVTGNGQIRN